MKFHFCLLLAVSCFLSVVTARSADIKSKDEVVGIDSKLPGSSKANVVDDPLCQNCDVYMVGGVSGTFTSPNYPNDYCDSIDCFYSIKVEQGLRIQLSFTAFDTEYCCDHVVVYDGAHATDNVILRAQGNYTLLPSVYSTSNEMLVRFTTDFSYTDAGWSATFVTF